MSGEWGSIPDQVLDLGNGWAAAECVENDGTTSLWLLSPTPDDEPGSADHHAAPHEGTGHLNTDWKRRVGLVCDAPTLNGTGCARPVHAFGDRCQQHRAPAVTDVPAPGAVSS